jgi:hypothetical protein
MQAKALGSSVGSDGPGPNIESYSNSHPDSDGRDNGSFRGSAQALTGSERSSGVIHRRNAGPAKSYQNGLRLSDGGPDENPYVSHGTSEPNSVKNFRMSWRSG